MNPDEILEASPADDNDREWARRLGYEEQAAIGAAKRCGVQWTPWMGDWFTSWSPRNGNNHAEGTWEHWVTLAQYILNDPLTAIVRPDVFEGVPAPEHRYDESERMLTDAELRTRFDHALRPVGES